MNNAINEILSYRNKEKDFISIKQTEDIIGEIFGFRERIFYATRLFINKHLRKSEVIPEGTILVGDAIRSLWHSVISHIFHYNQCQISLINTAVQNLKLFYVNEILVDSNILSRDLNKIKAVMMRPGWVISESQMNDFTYIQNILSKALDALILNSKNKYKLTICDYYLYIILILENE